MTIWRSWQRWNLKIVGSMALLLVLGLSACSGTGGGTLASATPDADLANPTYTLDAGDRVRVVVFRHEDLSGEFEVDGDGNFAMPLVGRIEASGLSSSELERQIETQLGDGYLVDPQVSVEVLNYRPFYILGEVNRPGVYEYLNGMTIINAVALAGGFTYRAAENSVTIKRGGSNADPVEVSAITPVLPGDVIQVPERFF